MGSRMSPSFPGAHRQAPTGAPITGRRQSHWTVRLPIRPNTDAPFITPKPFPANTSTLYTKAQGLQLSIRLGKYAHEGVQYTISSESPRASAVEYWSSGTEVRP